MKNARRQRDQNVAAKYRWDAYRAWDQEERDYNIKLAEHWERLAALPWWKRWRA